MPNSTEIPIGTVFADDFRIQRLLGRGGMGVVFVAEQLSTGKERALKVMSSDLLNDSRSRRRFEDEARAASRIRSDHVVEVIGAGVDRTTGTPWLAMELLEGQDLAQYLHAQGTVPLTHVSMMLGQLCHALAAAHAQGIVHRDLKPENIFVAKPRVRGLPFMMKILDFGIAKFVAETKVTTSLTGAIGTPSWMAPEQTKSAHAVTPATDIFSLGLIVFRMLTGRSYWQSESREDATLQGLLEELLITPLPIASSRAADLGVSNLYNPRLDAWFSRCLARDPSQRFQGAGEALTAWEETLNLLLSTPLTEPMAPARDSGAGTVRGTEVAAPAAGTARGTELASPADSAPRGTERGTPRPIASTPTIHATPSHATPYPAAQITPSAAPQVTPTPFGRTVSRADMAHSPARAGGEARPSHVPLLVAGFVVGGGLLALGGYFIGAASKAPATVATAPSIASSAPSPAASAKGPLATNPFIRVDPPVKAKLLLGVDEASAESPFVRGFRPARSVAMPTAAFEIQQHEVTWGEMEPEIAKEPRIAFATPNDLPRDRADLPVTGVPWDVALRYCRVVLGATLPTEAQWEYAARGPEARPFTWDDPTGDVTQIHAFKGVGAQPMSVMKDDLDKTWRSVRGLLGNAREWTAEPWREDFVMPDEPRSAVRAVRGLPLAADPLPVGADATAAHRQPLCGPGACPAAVRAGYTDLGDKTTRKLRPLFEQAISAKEALTALEACFDVTNARSGETIVYVKIDFAKGAWEESPKPAKVDDGDDGGALESTPYACARKILVDRVNAASWPSADGDAWTARVMVRPTLAQTAPDVGFRCARALGGG